MTFVPTVNDRANWFVRRGSVRPMSRREIINVLRKRRYMWGKSAKEIADEIGISADQVRSIILGNDFSDAIAAKVVTWIKRPLPAAALLPDRGKGQGQNAMRSRLLRRVIALCILGRQYKVRSRSNADLKAMTTGELRAYYYRLDERIKIAVCENYQGSRRFLLPDYHEAWEWIERLERLSGHHETSSELPASSIGRNLKIG